MCAFFVLLVSTSLVFAQKSGRDFTVYDPGDAIHPFKIISLPLRPPLALLNLFVRGGYYVLDSDPIRRAFNIDVEPKVEFEEDY